ncbi:MULTISPECIES: OmpA family protein [unclassified Arcicella]|uniref:OmpA family protein n=1 Tax=unclassified Arcicella TaxID=2644986 RepID=UPI0028647C9F|nr:MULTISPECIES: OmpA family protein [unclassified Arcicella]MDR6564448.1 outer membrane protein OmpA-like peptidoglycan-associated protein/Tol biopolymer transport system component [Arcicella sp. BE51]MDR6814307.1 outer membrane protein OmpA-like peptidoglycan-associated protein/Tol biopolymer transport system component [Arcicella sp. BE140]MDR6825671.1 outer membrane protein OmpA-like peptidoglycan-associated protein/Tol biopolymer transport system component [Arcicella sp. BE139]
MKNITFLIFSLIVLPCIPESKAQNKPESLGSAVNSEYSELNPVIAPDGRILYFGRKNHPQNKYGVAGTDQIAGSQDIWFSENVMGAWSTARRMPESLNRDQYNSILSISPDGQTILLKGAYVNGQYETRGFSIAKKSTNGWEIPKKVIIPKYERLSKGKNEYGFLSNDGKVLLMAFSEKKNSDEDDIYASFLENDGSWSEVMNLGDEINTNFTETTPFLAPDGKTLYFSSNRAGGKGSNDIWVAQRKDDSWIHWTEAINIGEPINTEQYDAYYTISAAGDYAYFVSGNNSLGKKDIFRLKLEINKPIEPKPSESTPIGGNPTRKSQDRRPVQPAPTKSDAVVLVSGKVIDGKTGKIPQNAQIIYEDLSTGKELGIATPDPITGIYKVVLPYGKNYGISTKIDGYIGTSQNIDLSKITGKYLEVEGKDMTVKPIEAGTKVEMNNIFFEFGKANLKPESYPELNRIANFFKTNTKLISEVSGHTDNVGSDEVNNRLSQERADVVRNYLLTQGVPAERISAKGYGKNRPKVANDTPENQAINRRVEFEILKN